MSAEFLAFPRYRYGNTSTGKLLAEPLSSESSLTSQSEILRDCKPKVCDSSSDSLFPKHKRGNLF